MDAAKATGRQTAPEVLARGGAVKAHAVLLVAEAEVPRTGYLLRQVSSELRDGHTVLVADFGGADGELLAGLSRNGRSVLADVDSREGVFPLAGLRALPAEAREAAGEILAGWLRPPGHLAESRDVRALIGLIARLPVLLPRTGLYAWRRFLIDRGFRRECVRGLRREGMDPSPLLGVRPGSVLWTVLSQRVEQVLGHDDTLDRVFPLADPAPLVEPSTVPELRIVQSQAPWAGRASRYPALLWLHLLAALASRPRRRRDGRSHVERLILIEPPPAAWGSADLLAPLLRAGLRVTVVTADRRASAPPEAWFGRSPAIVIQRSLGPERVASWGYLDDADAKRACSRLTGSHLLFVHQRGAPLERWCGLKVQASLPGVIPGALLAARGEGRRRYLIERTAVVENRRRIESHAYRATRRAASRDLLERSLRLERLTEAWRRAQRNKGAPGVDGVTVAAFAESWQPRLVALQAAVREGRYRPKPYLRLWVEKTSGGQRSMAIPIVADRVLMGAAAGALGSVLEPYFSDRSFAYRPGRSARGAILELMSSRRMATGWALIADIASYFDTIDHRLLLAMLREHVADEGFIRLVSAWITNPVSESGRQVPARRGVPQGAPISPVLSNLCLTPLDRWMEKRGLDYVRYADDFVALCDDATQAQQASQALEAFLARELKLSIKPTKTMFVPMAEGFEFLGFALNTSGAHIPVGRLEEARNEVRRILAFDSPTAATLESLDLYVRGFRNYFDLGTPSITEGLAVLEADRLRLVEAWAGARRLDVGLVRGRTERFMVEALPAPAPGAYAQEPQEAREGDIPLPVSNAGAPTSLATVDRRPSAVRMRAAVLRPTAVHAAGHLGIFGHGAVASLEQARLVLRRKQEVVFEVPVAALRTVQVDSYGMLLTTPLLEKLAEHDIPVMFARHGARPWAVLRPLTAKGSVELVRAQITAQAEPLAIAVAQELVEAKLANQERLLRYYAKYKRRRTTATGARLREAAGRIRKLASGLREIAADDVEAARRKIFSLEGRAGAIYWSALRQVLGDTFPRREGRGATDPINVALNYGYGILYAATWAAVARAGLDPGIGMLHASPGDRGALVFDLVEPFRVAVVDRPVTGLVSRGRQIKLNTDHHLTVRARQDVATAVGQALDRSVPWGGTVRPLAGHIDLQAHALATWLQGGPALRSLRIRW